MKFYNTIKSRAVAMTLAMVLCTFSNAQTGLLSPYSATGLGVEMPYLNARSAGMGGVIMGMAGSGTANPFNPASYRLGVDTMSVAFHVGLNMGFTELKQNIDGSVIQNHGTTGGLSNLEFYFPIFKWWKMGVYLLPMTEVAYISSGFRATDTTNIGRTQLLHTGTGGLNRLGWGNALGWGPVSVGFNISYIFGRVEELDRLIFLTDSLAMYSSETHDARGTAYNGLGFDAGIQYVQPLSRNSHITIGASYSMSALMDGKRSRLVTVEGIAGGSSYADTVYAPDPTHGKLKYPGVLRAGISYEQLDKFFIGADFSYSWWNELSSELETFAQTSNTYKVSIGAEVLSDLRSTFWARRLSYRIGANWQTYNYNYAGKQVTGFGVSAGIGIPIRRSRSSIYIFGEYSRMGSLKSGQIENNIGRIGVSFSSVETWFVKRKYD
jgi:hypothetical protein